MRTPVELSHPIYHDEDAARSHLEAIRWPNGPVCPYCGSLGETVRALAGESMGKGWYYCGECQKKFTVRVGAVYERSHIPLHKWLLGFRLYASSKKGFSAHQLHRTMNITYKSAWFMAHRIREAMNDSDPAPLGGKGKVVEVDETFIGPAKDIYVNERGWMKERGTGTKRKVITLVERGGRARSIKVDDLSAKTIRKVLFENIVLDSRLHTDEAHHYRKPGVEFAAHERVNHSAGEYARGDVTTNTVEGFFSIFKRGMVGIYQHCGEKHLQRYLNEFDFRYSNRVALGIDDAERTTRAIKGASGKRLTYREPRSKRGQVA
jgi:transposase-like protein